MRDADLKHQLSGLLSAQRGLFTQAPAAAAAVPRDRVLAAVSAGQIEEIAGGVFRFVGDPESSEQDLFAAWLQLDLARSDATMGDEPHAVVSHESAAAARELGSVLPLKFRFVGTRDLRVIPASVRYERATLDSGDWEVIDGLPVATVHRILHDLLTETADTDDVAEIAADAIRAGLLSRDELSDIVAPHVNRYGYATPEEFCSSLELLAKEIFA